MKNRFTILLVPLALAAGAWLLSGCHPESGHVEGDGHDHAGHAHVTQAGTDGMVMKCARHGAPVTLCFICDASLREAGRLWCREHDRYEDRCWECHPELREADRLFCDEHGLYEDECFLCRPELKAASSADQRAGMNCEEHGVPEAECGICHPELITRLKPGEGMKVRLPAMDSARSAGVETGKPSMGTIAEGIECYAETEFNQNKLAQIVAPVGGILQEVTVDLGARVEEKQTVARLWSASIAEAVAKAVLTHQTLDRENRLRAERVTSLKDLQEAEASHRAACQQLRTLGFTEEQIDALGGQPREEVLMEVRAPFAGEIVERTAVRGALVESGKRLFTLADRSVMWAMLNLPESAGARVRVGQTVEMQFDSLPGRTFAGNLTWVSAEVDERSRMVRARAEVKNPDAVLKAGMFARARILARSSEGALLLPASAIQQVEGRPMVFVKLAEDLFEARGIQLGARYEATVEVLQGVRPEEEVALNRVFPLKSQLLSSQLGAGCAHEK